LAEQIDLYIGVVVTLMFLAGCFLTVLSARDRAEKRSRWLDWRLSSHRTATGQKTFTCPSRL